MNDSAAGEVSVISLGTSSVSTPPTDISINVGADPNSTVSDVKTPQSSGADHSPNSDFEEGASGEPVTQTGGEGGVSSEQDRDQCEDNQVSWATLYCPENGRSHATLLDFGLGECPKCSQNLMAMWTQPAWPQQEFENPQEYSSQRFNNEAGPPLPMNGEAEQSAPAPEVHGDPKTKPSSIVTYCLEYRDSGNNIITTVPWAGPFDSSVIRKNAEVKQVVIFNVTTVLETSVPSDPHRYAHETEGLLQNGIITNPIIDVGVHSTRITIFSKSLLNALAHVVTYYPAERLGGEYIQLNAPFTLIGHHLSELEAYRATYREDDVGSSQPDAADHESVLPICDKETFDQLGLLLHFVKDSFYKDRLSDELARHSRNRCTFPMLWLLFKPGETVYMESGGQLSAYVVQYMQVDRTLLSSTSRKFTHPYIIQLWNLDFNGTFVGRRSRTVTIAHFDGERQVTSLKIFPGHFIDRQDNGRTRKHLEDLGQKWYELLQGKQVFYSGEFLGPSKRQYQGRVYVDSASYFAQHEYTAPDICEVEDMGDGLAKCLCEECRGWKPHPLPDFRWAAYDLLDPRADKDLELPQSPEGARHRYLLCSRVLYGLVLKSRTWEELNVAYCQEPKVNRRAIDSLVMPEARKEMIRALVQKYTDPTPDKRSKSWGADFIENKGEGQIFLLHGSPGVGKTFVKCIAEYTGRALLSLTVGDIGTDEVVMEKQLSKWFRLAEQWGAVMLIDEADVYLERRQITDLKRNSLVSVFLRCIEYYRGILFLTTNRVGHFDDAFISRIHVVIRYDNLSEENRRTIWEQFFDKLTDERHDFVVTRRAKSYVLEDEVISKMQWNGREIRNAFQTAVALAEYRFSQKPDKSKDDGPTLDQRDFEQVCNMTRDFKQYLTIVHGIDEEDRAFHAKGNFINILPPTLPIWGTQSAPPILREVERIAKIHFT
ncbi:hypothetical protein BDQ94DRAFT_185416 [Aspergillus welwitschiae]|uniref:AAA+ ATPase domain-containing protein n=1 Tax=Aspergillus welwitschiae TaxID=1341132 RepID=A0A3F3QAU6_9EURO|nr:hypothetical protein BDQ94DRAFT_185416 [Aspergillus welwitschiae]RDH36293.1 hypothetical protein BDQ94DRAFT_185416 [Aspergillus welwitschiae]